MKGTKTIRTKRLTIRRFVPEDWPDLLEYLSDPRVVKYEPYEPINQVQSIEIAQNHSESEVFWAVCLKNKVIGNIYLEEVIQDSWEVGFVFHYDFQHQGYAYEAISMMIDRIFAQGAHRVFAECHPDNQASWKLLEKLGFKREGHLRKNIFFNQAADGTPLWQDTYVYGLLREDYKGKNT
ncbi:GNAT family protein [Enterococcus hulanensis]|uniref:GNAT family N-acetyltransferase n=1 Tax=Enterococcus hulanensis TaxID=2559929 RepID=UPI00288E05EE|nr:GNAT family protein [Enterococcus hulanensis]MDT2660414.1 GNAT family protein [Enterococcus hulanensis]